MIEETKETRKNPKKRAFNELANDDWETKLAPKYEDPRLTRVQKKRVDEIAEQLAFLESQEMVRMKQPAVLKPHRPKFRRNLSMDEHRRVVYLRFHSLTSPEELWFSSKEVF
jgi:hypothetical protein